MVPTPGGTTSATSEDRKPTATPTLLDPPRSRYDPNKPLDDESNASKAKQELDRYLHFYQRYHNHNNAQKFASGQREATEKRMVDMQEVLSLPGV